MFEKFSVRKPMTVAVAVIAVILLGIISFTKMPTDLLPSMDLPYAAVITAYPGASPEKVESAVTRPLEQSLATLSGVEQITSVSNENSSMIILEFSQGINMDSVMIEMNSNLDLVKSSLDDGVGSPMVMKINPDMMPVMIASVDAEGKDLYELSSLVNDEIVPAFERVDGVASVTASGLVEKQLSVTLNQEKIDAINQKILDAVDEQMAQAEAKMQEGETQLASAKSQMEEQKKTQTASLSEKALQLANGKDQVQTGLSALPAAQATLQQNLSSLTQQKQALQKLLEIQQQAGIEPTPTEQELLTKLSSGIEQCETGLSELSVKQQSLTETLKGLNEAEQQLESGRATMNAEFVKAEMTLQQKQEELASAREQLDEANKTAYQQAGLDGRLTVSTVSQMLAAQNFSMPAGYLEDGEEQFAVKVGDKFADEEELRNLVLFSMDVGDIGAITLSDVADIAYTDNADEMYAKINGNDGILLSFQKQSTASTAEVSDKIAETMQKLSEEQDGLHVTALNDQGTYIDIVVNSVIQNLLLGGLLAILILLLFLRNARPTVIIAFSIPISLMFAVVLMYFSGVTLNVISLAGLALGVGMLVDNSIVVIENTYRLRSQGMSAMQAAVKGASQVAGAITSSTLTTICVFLPIVFMEGLSRQLFMDMGLTIAYSLLASLLVALTLVPALSSTVLRKSVDKPHKLFDRFKNFYGRMLSKALRVKPVIILFSVVLLVGSSVGAVFAGTALMPETDSRQVMVTMEMPPESTAGEARDAADTLIERIEQIDGVQTVGAMEGGLMSGMMGGSSSSGSMMMYVLLEDDRSATSNEIAAEIEKTAEDLPCTLTASGSGLDMSALGGSGIQITVKGDHLDALQETSAEIAGMLGEVEGLTEISDGQEQNDTELRIEVDKTKAAEYGLMVAQVYQQVAAALTTETEATTLDSDTESVPVIVVSSEESRLSRENLTDFELTGTKNGEETKVRLGDLAEIKEAESLSSIRREGQVRTMTVSAEVDDAHNIGLVGRDVEAKLKDYQAPEGVTVTMEGENETINQTLGDLMWMILLAIALIYLIMVAQFQSLKSPFIVLFTIPLAFTGGFLALLLTGMEVSMIAMMGFLVLSGVVVNNGIVFVDCVNQLWAGGMEKRQALIEAGKMRIRPILMTALTTILGLSTLALGMGMGADMIQPMAVVTIGGLAYATVLTLFVVPVIYDLFNRKPPRVRSIEEDDEG